MSNRRVIVNLVIAILALAGIHFALSMRGSQSTALRTRQTLLESPPPYSGIVIERCGRAAVKLVSLPKWRLVEPFVADVDETRVLQFLDALALTPIPFMQTVAEVHRMEKELKDFVPDEPRLAVTVTGADGRATRISFSRAIPLGSEFYARVDGVDAVFTVPSNVCAAVDLTADVLRSRVLFSEALAEKDVLTVDLKRGLGSFLRLVRSGEDWMSQQNDDEKAHAAAARVKKLVSETLAASAIDFVWPVGATNEVSIASASLLAGYGLDPESAVTVTFKSAAGRDHWISFGKTAAEGQVYALAQNGGAIVTVNAGLRDQAAAESKLFVDTRLFPLEPARVTGFTLTDGGVSYMLAKEADGDWRLDSPITAPADAGTVKQFVARILDLRTTDVVSAGGVQISLATNTSPVMVTRQALMAGRRFEDLRSRTLLKIPRTEIKRLVSTGADGRPVAVVYDRERKAWTVELPDGAAPAAAGTVDLRAVEGVLAALESLEAERVECIRVEPLDLGRYGLDAPKRKLAVDLAHEESVRRNVLIGTATKGGCFVTIGSSDAVFVVADSVIARLTAALVMTQP